jgi:hypothetical protein
VILFLLALANSNVAIDVRLDRETATLSDIVAATLVVEGPAPLAVELPAAWLDAESMPHWHATPAGPASIEPLPGGRERWTQRMMLDPFAVGPAIPLSWNSIRVTAGDDRTAKPYTWPTRHVAVTSDIESPRAADTRPLAGMLVPPDNPPSRTVARMFGLTGCVVLTSIAAALVVRRSMRTASRVASPSSPGELAAIAEDRAFLDAVAARHAGDAAKPAWWPELDRMRFRSEPPDAETVREFRRRVSGGSGASSA